MKKPHNYSLLVYAALAIILVVFGRVLINQHGSVINSFVLFALATLAIGFVLTTILYEIGHIIGAKIGGYDILSVNFFGISFCKIKGKIVLKSAPYNGFTGETKVVPTRAKTNPKAFFNGGYILTLLIDVVAILVAALVPGLNEKAPVFVLGTYFSCGISFLIVLYSLLPIPLDCVNDASHLRFLKKGNIQYYDEYLKKQSELYDGNPLKNIEPCGIYNPVFSKHEQYAYLSAVYEGDFKKAQDIVNNLIEHSNKLDIDTFNILLSDQIYCFISTDTKENVSVFFNNKMDANSRALFSKASTIDGARCMIELYGLIQENEAMTRTGVKKFNELIKSDCEVGRHEQELSLVNEAIAKINEAHPEWNIAL